MPFILNPTVRTANTQDLICHSSSGPEPVAKRYHTEYVASSRLGDVDTALDLYHEHSQES